MTPRTYNAVPTLALLALCGLAAGCERDPRPKERPEGVPPTAVWAGGPDGGAYIECNWGGPVNECSVWNDGSGDLWYRGRFVIEGTSRAATPRELEYASADGTRIFLQKGLTLRPIK